MVTDLPAEHFESAQQMDDALIALLESHAYDYGRGYDSYLVMELNREYFWSSGRRGVLGFVRHGRYAMVIGGLLAPAEDWDQLLIDFLAFVKKNKYVVMCHNIDPEQVEAFRRHGFQITKVGEETVLDLEQCTWKGKNYEWVRRQSNYCLRQGLICNELLPDQQSGDAWEQLTAEMLEVSKDFLRSKPQGGQMRYFVSQFEPNQLWRRRLFVARADGGQGRVMGFIVCNPCMGGKLWAIEMWRQRADAPRGVIPFMMHQAFQTMQTDGIPKASLSMVPALRCEQPMPGDSKVARWFMVKAPKHLGLIYDLQGLYHFKSRFRPDFQNCYLAAYPKATLMSLRAMMIVWRVDRVNPLRIMRRMGSRFLKRESRKSLANFETGKQAAD